MATFDLIGVGSPIMDLLAQVSDEFLRQHVAGEKGGMVLVDHTDIAQLMAKVIRGQGALRTIMMMPMMFAPILVGTNVAAIPQAIAPPPARRPAARCGFRKGAPPASLRSAGRAPNTPACAAGSCCCSRR